MDDKLLKSVIGRFDRNAFEGFFQKLLAHPSYGREVKRLTDIDDRIYDCLPERFNYSVDAFFMCYSPHTIYERFLTNCVDLFDLKNLITKYINNRKYDGPWIPQYAITLHVINNFDSNKLGITDEELALHYEKELNVILPSSLYQIGVGNINTFVNATKENPKWLQNILCDFLTANDEGICISVSDSCVQASQFSVENEFAGATKHTKSLIQPVYRKMFVVNDVLNEFNKLIFCDAKEKVLEDFLRQHFQVIFGGKYDRISTQLWLKFPEIDIGSRDRRLDILMRNSIMNDWELYELKRSNISLTKTIADVPMFVSAVNDAVAQAKNYKRLLQQDEVKSRLSSEGIEYFEPEINLVIGKKPSIPINQWRRLYADNQNNIKIITYDTLLEEAKQRLFDAESLLK